MFRTISLGILLGLTAIVPAGGAAAAIADGSNDFLATYGGPQTGDFDILGADARFDGSHFRLTATLAGTPGATTGSLYVFGINRGAGSARLQGGMPPVGAGILFDSVAVLFPDGLGRIATFPAMGAPTITNLAGIVTISGNSISALFPLMLLPSRGFQPEDYRFSLWSRKRVNPMMDGTSAEIADFAPNASGFRASVPEPASWAMMIAGFGLAGAAARRRGRIAYA